MCSGDTESPEKMKTTFLGAGVNRQIHPRGEDIVRVLRSLGFYVTETRDASVIMCRGIHRVVIPSGEMTGDMSVRLQRMLRPIFEYQDWDAIKRIRDWVVASDAKNNPDCTEDPADQITEEKLRILET